jgi:hypothetical protein
MVTFKVGSLMTMRLSPLRDADRQTHPPTQRSAEVTRKVFLLSERPAALDSGATSATIASEIEPFGFSGDQG